MGVADISLRYWFYVLRIYTQKRDYGLHDSFIFYFLRKLHAVFHNNCTKFPIPTERVPGFHFLHIPTNTYLYFFFILATLTGDISLRILFPFLWWVVILSTFYVPVGHLYVFFRINFIQVLCPFFNCVFKVFSYCIVGILLLSWTRVSLPTHRDQKKCTSKSLQWRRKMIISIGTNSE